VVPSEPISHDGPQTGVLHYDLATTIAPFEDTYCSFVGGVLETINSAKFAF